MGSVDLTTWLWVNQDAILNGGLMLGGQLVTGESRLHYYDTVTSFLLLTTRKKHGPFLAGSAEAHSQRNRAMTTTALLGWWGIPWGPIYSIGALASNANGGGVYTVSDHLAHLALLQAKADAKAASKSR
jgi:hypothetical protein